VIRLSLFSITCVLWVVVRFRAFFVSLADHGLRRLPLLVFCALVFSLSLFLCCWPVPAATSR